MKVEVVFPTASLIESGYNSTSTVYEMDDAYAEKCIKEGVVKKYNEAAKLAEDNELADFEAKALKAMTDTQEKFLKDDWLQKAGLGDASAKQIADVMQQVEDERKRKEEKSKRFKCFGDNVQAIAASLGLDFRGNHEALAHKSLLTRAVKAPTGQGETTNADGGFLVDVEFDRVLDTRMVETSLLIGRTDAREIGAGFNGMKWNGLIDYDRTDTNHPAEVYYTNEADAKTAKKWTVERLSLELLKLAALNYLTDELLQDTTNLEADVTEWFQNEFGWKIDNGIFEGAGGTAMTGILGHASNIAVVRNATGTVNITDVTGMFSRLNTRSKSNAATAWYVNPDVVPALQVMTLGDQPIYMPAGGASAAPYATLMGKPIIELEHAKTVGTLGDINLWDCSQYRYISKGGTQVDTSNIPRFINDETVMRFVKRVNGIPKWTTVRTPQNGSNTVSPFVSLATFV